MTQLQIWLMAARPKTLIVSCTPIIVGTGLAIGKTAAISWGLMWLTIICAILIQIGINITNDAIDFKKGADQSDRLGPQRITQSGLMSYTKVMKMGLICFLLAFICGIPLMTAGGWPLIVAILASIIFGYLYTGGPLPLAYKGLGEIFILVFFGYVITCSAFYLQTSFIDFDCLLAATQMGLLATVPLVINNARDIATDQAVNKMTLSARFGLNFSRWEVAIFSFIPFLLGWIWFYKGYVFMALLPFCIAPMIYKNIQAIWVNAPSFAYNHYLAQSAKHQFFFSLLLISGYFL